LKSQKLSRHYDSLTPDERFKLALAALSRGDEDELLQLYATCPRKTYSMPDAAFHDKLEVAKEPIKAFTTLILEQLMRVNTVSVAFLSWRMVALSVEEGFGIGLSVAAEVPDEPHSVWAELDLAVDKQVATADMFLKELTKSLSELVGVQEGLRRFCEDKDVDMNATLASYPPIQWHIQQVESLCSAISKHLSEVDPDEEAAEETAKCFDTLWQRLVP